MCVQVWTGRGCEKAQTATLALRLHKTPNFLILFLSPSLYNKKLKGINDHQRQSLLDSQPHHLSSELACASGRLR